MSRRYLSYIGVTSTGSGTFFERTIRKGIASLYDKELTSGVTVAVGGSVLTLNGYRYHSFYTSDTFTINSGITTAEILLVAGGGGGGGGYYDGGGGGGGVVYVRSGALTPGNYPVVVGAGGAGASPFNNGTSGSDSTFTAIDTLRALGGGGGGGGPSSPPALFFGKNGGSGGGSSYYEPTSAGIASAQPVPANFSTTGNPQYGAFGNPGAALATPSIIHGYGGGGGGAAGGPPAIDRRQGGAGRAIADMPYTATGTPPSANSPSANQYGGGGAGGPGGAGGAGGGAPSPGGAGTAGLNRAGGGGSGAGLVSPGGSSGGAGGNGIVVIRYPYSLP